MKFADKIIVYHVYGSQTLYNQVLFSILTLYHYLKEDFHGLQIVIYTDNAKFFERYVAFMPLILEPLDNNTIAMYKGKYNFVHRVKICIIRACMEKYNKSIFYLDSDTYFTNTPINLLQRINSDTSIMNVDELGLNDAEGIYEAPSWLDIRKAINNFQYNIEGKSVKIPITTRMWNAGVIGLSYRNKYLLDKISDLSDQIYANRPVFTAEQFAFSYFLQNKTNLISTEDVILHYWPNFVGKNWKRKYNYHFNLFFKKYKHASIEVQAAKAYELSLQHDQLMMIPERTFVQKIYRRLKLIVEVARYGKVLSLD